MTELREFDRAELVRLERMRGCHDDDRPTAGEIAAALGRLGTTRRRHREQRVTRTLAIAAAVSLSTLGALATTEKLGLTALAGLWHSKTKAPALPPVPSARPPLVPPRERLSRPAASHVAAQTASAAAAIAPGTGTAGVPPVARAQVAAARDSGEGAEAWAKAAAALKLGDRSTAQDALRELARSDDEETRAAALLARAELDLVTGEEARARAVLSALAERGATPFVRKRARQILAGER
jgi:hypothetical protein